MAALTADRLVTRREGGRTVRPLANAVTIWGGAIVALTITGAAVPAGHADGTIIDGVAEKPGEDGRVETRRGVYLCDNHATDPITRADIGRTCFAADDQTVAKTNGGGARLAAGRVIDVEGFGVWVEFS